MNRITIISLLLGAFVLGALSPLSAQEEQMNQITVERFTEEFLNEGKVDVIDDIYAADGIHHSPVGDLNVEARKMVRAGFGAAFPDFHLDTDTLVANGEWVAVLHTFKATFTGQFMTPDGQTIPGNNAPIEMKITEFYHFNADGKIDESWENFDNLYLLTTMGILPTPGG
jgi:predicted ester cyclase